MSLLLPDERHFKLPAREFVWEMPLVRDSGYSILLWRTATALIQREGKASRRYVNGVLRRTIFIAMKARMLLVRVILLATAAVDCILGKWKKRNGMLNHASAVNS